MKAYFKKPQNKFIGWRAMGFSTAILISTMIPIFVNERTFPSRALAVMALAVTLGLTWWSLVNMRKIDSKYRPTLAPEMSGPEFNRLAVPVILFAQAYTFVVAVGWIEALI